MDSWGSSDGGGSDSTDSSNDATAYGGKNAGFDPNTPGLANQYKGNTGNSGFLENTESYTPNTPVNGEFAPQAVGQDQFSYLKQLSDMFSSNTGSLNQLANLNFGGYTTGSDMNAQTGEQALSDQGQYAGTESPSWARRMGIIPGMSQNQFFAQESPSQNTERMGMINEGAGNFGAALMRTMMPAPIAMGLNAYGAYKNWDSSKPLQSAGRALQGLPGYFGAAGNVALGNYGSALTGGLMKAGNTPMNAAGAGIGLDAALGKDVTRPAAGLAGYYAGSQAGGPVGGVLGQNLARMFTRKK